MKLKFTAIDYIRAITALAIGFYTLSFSIHVDAQTMHNDRINIGLAYPISSNGIHAAADTNIFSLNLIAGVSAGETGFSFAGVSSVVKNDALGMQFAGFINIAKKVSGAQIAGFFNLADSSDYPIGLINLIRHGEKSIGISMDENETGMLSFRSGGKVLYGIIAAGYNFRNTEEVCAFEAGIGAHFVNTPVFRINAELSTQTLESFKSGEYFKSSVRLMPSLRPVPGLEIFGGPVLIM